VKAIEIQTPSVCRTSMRWSLPWTIVRKKSLYTTHR